MNNQPTHKIHGKRRHELKKELSWLKFYVKTYWYNHQLEKDIYNFVGDTMPMSDTQAKEVYERAIKDVESLEEKLREPYEEV